MAPPLAELTAQAQTLTSAGDLRGARAVLDHALDPRDTDPQHATPDLAVAAALHARILIALGDPHAARIWAGFAHAAEERLHGPHDERTLGAAAVHAAVLARIGNHGRAAQLYHDLVRELVAREGPESPRALAAEADLATAEHAAGHCTAARDRLGNAWVKHRQAYGDAAPAGIKMLARLGAMERECGRHAESREHLSLARDLANQHLPTGHPLIAQVTALIRAPATGRHVCGRVQQSTGPGDHPAPGVTPVPARGSTRPPDTDQPSPTHPQPASDSAYAGDPGVGGSAYAGGPGVGGSAYAGGPGVGGSAYAGGPGVGGSAYAGGPGVAEPSQPGVGSRAYTGQPGAADQPYVDQAGALRPPAAGQPGAGGRQGGGQWPDAQSAPAAAAPPPGQPAGQPAPGMGAAGAGAAGAGAAGTGAAAADTAAAGEAPELSVLEMPAPDDRVTDPKGGLYQQPLYLSEVHQAPGDLTGRHARADTPLPLPGQRVPEYTSDGRRVPVGTAPVDPAERDHLLPVHVPREEEPTSKRPFVLAAVLVAAVGVAAAAVAVFLPRGDADTPATTPPPATAAQPSAPAASAPPESAPPAPAVAGAPANVALVDNRDSVTLTWTYPKGSEGPVLISGGRDGQDRRAFQQLPAGSADYVVYGLNERLNYCFTVAVVNSTDDVATSAPICTAR